MSRSTSATENAGVLERLWRCCGAVTAVEFAFLLPILIGFTFGLIELGLILFDYHRLGEAARRGARTAIVDPPVASLANLFGNVIVCQGNATGVSCSGGAVASVGSFTNIVGDMQAIMPDLQAENVRITYRDSGITGPPATPGIVTPTVTVEVTDFEHPYLFLDYFPGVSSSFIFPTFSTSRVGPSQNAS